MSPRQQAPLTLEFILLGIIARRPIHGYNIYKELDRLDGLGMIWQLKQSQLYALLDKLENDGLIHSTRQESENRPTRNEYQLSEYGRLEFEHWRSSPVLHPRDLRQEFLARLFFAREAGSHLTSTLLEKQEQVAQQWLRESLQDLAALTNSQDYERTVIQFRIRQIEASLDWLHYCKSIFEEQLS